MHFFDDMKELEKGNKVINAACKDAKYLYKESILNKTEKEYILNIIKPFKNKICYIVKYKSICPNNEEYLQICVKSYNRYINLPTFARGSMYNNMKLAHAYSLKELGLDE